MLPESCPKCGAAVHAPPNATRAECRYCNHVMQDEAPPAPPPSAGPPQIIVVQRPAAVVYSTTSTWTRYWIQMAFVLGIVFLSGGGWWFRRMRSSMSSISDLGIGASIGGWDGQSPFLCGANDSIDISGVNANFGAGAAMTVSGNCHVTCRDCNLRAPVAVEADGNGQVTFVNGTITGTESSFVASGNATISVTGNARVTGPYRQSANGKVLGVSQPPATHVAPAAPPPPVPPHFPPHPGMAPHGPPLPPPRRY